jgi:hypothetical protein
MRVRVPPPVLAWTRRHARWAIAVVPALVLAVLCSRVSDWAVMTDELLYQRLALSFVDGSFFPTLHGERVDVYAVLYPFLLMPVYALVDLPDAVRVAHGLNGVLFASAIVPTYLLARGLALPRFAVLAASAFTVAIPWTVIAGFVMTESAAYPAALWAVLAVQRAVVVPSRRRDLVALGAIAVAALARPQLAGLGVAFVAAVVAHEARFGRWREHTLVLAVGAVAIPVVLLAGGGLLGSYGATLEEGAVISVEGLRSALVHVNVTAVALGIVPLLLGGGWAVAALVRAPAEPERHAFAAVVVATTTVLAIETGSVVVRFGLGLDVKDRYFFYAAPLLFLATACALDDPRPRLVGLLGLTAAFVGTVGLASFSPVFGVNIDSPASTHNEELTLLARDLGLSVAELLAIVAGLLAVALVLALKRVRRRPLAMVALGTVLAFVLAESVYTWDRLYASSGPSGRPLTTAQPSELSWIDAAIPGGTVAMLPNQGGADWFASAGRWWDVEFWNERVVRAYMLGGYFTYTPETFPRASLRVDPLSGSIEGAAPDYIVRSVLDARLAPAGLVAAQAPELEAIDLEVPRRAQWLTLGLDPDGWIRSGRRAFLRVFPPAGAVGVELTVSTPRQLEQPLRTTVGPVSVELGPNESRVLAFEVCVPDGGYADIEVTSSMLTTIPGIATNPPNARYRNVGVRLSRITTGATSEPCQT